MNRRPGLVKVERDNSANGAAAEEGKATVEMISVCRIDKDALDRVPTGFKCLVGDVRVELI